ncbi:MAG: nucleotidyltransferase family protein [Firmicutes bacterium]|jgi:hypothetical protein|nr:nucleotidyltransferase family protein [Bacillota bacterium]
METMMIPPSLPLAIKKDVLTEICRRYRVQELALFGSVLRNDFAPTSDVDVAVSFLFGTLVTLFWLGGLAAALETLFGRPVDLVPTSAIRPILREEILSTKETIYVQTTTPN